MECEICFELYDNEDRTPLVLACKCRKVMCLCCVTRRLDSTARCPYCDIRWSVRSYINQCRQITPSNMLIQLLDLQKSKGSETPHNEKYSNLGSGELREYYEMSVQNIIRKANENAAEQIEGDQSFAKILFEKLQREAEEETVVIKQMEEEDALLAVKIANESQNRLVKKDGGCSKEQKNGIERFVRKDKRSIAHRASSSPSQQAAVSSTSSSSSPRQIINLITEEVIIGNDSTTLEHMNRDDNRAFNSSVRLSSAAGIAANSLNKRTKVSATSLASSCAPKNGISSFFLKRPISTVYNSSGFHDLISGDEPSRHKSRLFDSEIEILD